MAWSLLLLLATPPSLAYPALLACLLAFRLPAIVREASKAREGGGQEEHEEEEGLEEQEGEEGEDVASQFEIIDSNLNDIDVKLKES